MLITVNLEEALRHLRKVNSVRTVWIDAVCIDQHDLAERSSQVQEMGNIYNFAERVLIWLGLPNREHGLAADEIQRLANFAQSTDSLTSRNDLETANKLLSHPWWKRVWVVQEVSRARRDSLVIVDRDLHLSWSDLAQLVDRRLAGRNISDSRFKALVNLVSVRQRTWTPPRLRFEEREPLTADVTRSYLGKDLYYLLDLTRDFHASDPRDKVFALWTLARGTYSHRLTPDYSKSMPDAYTAATLEGIQETDGLEILSRRWNSPSPDLPSWVPNYSLPVLPQFPVTARLSASATKPQYVISGSPFAARSDCPEDPRLRVQGMRVCNVEHVLTIAEFANLDRKHSQSAKAKRAREQEITVQGSELEELQARRGMVVDDNHDSCRGYLKRPEQLDARGTEREEQDLHRVERQQKPYIPLIIAFASWLAQVPQVRAVEIGEHGASRVVDDTHRRDLTNEIQTYDVADAASRGNLKQGRSLTVQQA